VVVLGAIVFCPSAMGRYGLLGLDRSGPMIASLFTAITMAYFFGRLDSFDMNVQRWALAPLYLYVAIQANWFSFGDTIPERSSRAVFLGLALLLKVYLFIAVTHWLLHGNIQRYLGAKADAPRSATDTTHEEKEDQEIALDRVGRSDSSI
jgi:hypothetical protein